MGAKIIHRYTIGFLIFAVLLILGGSILEVFPLFPSNNDTTINEQSTLQLARAEFIVKDIFTLAYRPTSYHAQALSEIQIELPQFQEVQQGLLHGDSVLNLPSTQPDNVLTALNAAQTSYLTFVTAVKTIIANPDKTPDPVELEIVAQQERPYVSEMAIVIEVLNQNTQSRLVQLIVLKMFIYAAIFVTISIKYFLFTQPMIHKMVQQEQIVVDSDGKS